MAGIMRDEEHRDEDREASEELSLVERLRHARMELFRKRSQSKIHPLYRARTAMGGFPRGINAEQVYLDYTDRYVLPYTSKSLDEDTWKWMEDCGTVHTLRWLASKEIPDPITVKHILAKIKPATLGAPESWPEFPTTEAAISQTGIDQADLWWGFFCQMMKVRPDYVDYFWSQVPRNLAFLRTIAEGWCRDRVAQMFIDEALGLCDTVEQAHKFLESDLLEFASRWRSIGTILEKLPDQATRMAALRKLHASGHFSRADCKDSVAQTMYDALFA